MSDPAAFVKADGRKVRLDLLPVLAVEAVGRVLTFGARKYAPNNWRKVDDMSRYTGAALRHIFAYMRGEVVDEESGEHHLAHAACCLLFIVDLEADHGGRGNGPDGCEPIDTWWDGSCEWERVEDGEILRAGRYAGGVDPDGWAIWDEGLDRNSEEMIQGAEVGEAGKAIVERKMRDLLDPKELRGVLTSRRCEVCRRILADDEVAVPDANADCETCMECASGGGAE